MPPTEAPSEAPAEAPTGWRRRWDGVGARLARAFVLVLLPPLAFLAYQAVDTIEQARHQQATVLAQGIDLITRYERSFFARTQSLLERLADDAAVRLNTRDCPAVLAQARLDDAAYRQLALVDAAGNALCTAVPAASADGLGPGSLVGGLVRRVLDSGGFELGEVVQWENGERRAVLGAAVPVVRDADAPTVLTLTIDLAEVERAIQDLALPEHAVAALVDGTGRLLLGDLAAGQPRLAPMPETASLTSLVLNAGVARDALGRDGLLRRYAAQPLAEGRLYLVTGIARGGSWAWLTDRVLLTVAAVVGFLAASVVVTLVAADWLINRHIRRLAATTRGYFQAGETAWPDIQDGPTELRDLADDFRRLIEQVADRERSLEQSLADKEVLLREVHHRVKNNLQTVISLLALRSRRTASPIAQRAIEAAGTRVRALALLHSHLYQQDDLREVALRPFLTDLCGLVETAVDGITAPVTLELDVAPMSIDAGRAVPLALLVVEAVSNAYEHAFAGRAHGTIRVSLQPSEAATAVLSVRDDGIGLANPADRGLGLTLAHLLAGQIGGSFRIVAEAAGGTTLRATFPLEPTAVSPTSGRGRTAAQDMGREADREQHQEEEKQDLRDVDRDRDDPGEAQQAGDQGDDQKSERQLQHARSPFEGSPP
ncbi:MAG: sensor histidine kinase [Geminicoccaceae bacterium]|nr:MAG: sensor histidine kinase [Geminicoccaceae bacterium]